MVGPGPPLTIGLPVYNGERFVAEAVESILAQEFGDFLLTISDNASTDATEEICRELAARDARITYERHTTNRGAAWNYNHLARSATSPFFKWAAHDDVLRPTAISRCMEALCDRPEAVLSFPRRMKIDERGDVVKVNRPRALRFTAPDASPHERFDDWL